MDRNQKRFDEDALDLLNELDEGQTPTGGEPTSQRPSQAVLSHYAHDKRRSQHVWFMVRRTFANSIEG